jgi:hypothetical protein
LNSGRLSTPRTSIAISRQSPSGMASLTISAKALDASVRASLTLGRSNPSSSGLNRSSSRTSK